MVANVTDEALLFYDITIYPVRLDMRLILNPNSTKSVDFCYWVRSSFGFGGRRSPQHFVLVFLIYVTCIFICVINFFGLKLTNV